MAGPRCEHCGDPAFVRADGKVLTFRREPICDKCEWMMKLETGEKEFLDFLRKGGIVVEARKTAKGT